MANYYAAVMYEDRVRRALSDKQDLVHWVAVGRTTAWPDEESPPEVQPGSTTFDEPIVYVKAQTVALCVLDPTTPDFYVDQVGYRTVADEDAYTEAARYLYIRAELDGDTPGMPTGNYRQKAIFCELVPAAGHETDDWLAPANVSDVGIMRYLVNKTVKSFGSGEVREERTVIEYR